LGLTAVDGIVRGYYGGLELMSVEGQGTRIRVLFPTLPSVASASLGNTSTHVVRFNKDAPERRGTILVVDDDENTCELMTTVLDRADFRVIQASGGAAAVKFYERHMDDIDGVVLDYTMPLISGAEVFDSIRSMRPDARIILVSGYAQARAAEDLMGRGLYGFLQKPFTPEDLVREAERMFAEVTAE
jgi:CheY-like chemotaxis protein